MLNINIDIYTLGIIRQIALLNEEGKQRTLSFTESKRLMEMEHQLGMSIMIDIEQRNEDMYTSLNKKGR